MINWIIITGFSILGFILCHMDQKRISDPYYKQKVQKIRDENKFKFKEKLKHRLLIFPASNNKKHIKNFVIQEVKYLQIIINNFAKTNLFNVFIID